jgi:DNA ligase (NAD+)
MEKQQAKERIEKLKQVINEARYSYHVLDKTIMSDAALDSLKHELFELEQEYPQFITSDSPTQRIGGKPLDEFKKIRHKVSQWSFNDVFDESEIRNFDERMRRELGNKEVDYTTELKIDGMHIILTYEKGLFKTGATRGDGKIGEDVSHN